VYTHRTLRRQAWKLAWRNLHAPLVVNGSIGLNPAGAQCVNVPNAYWDELGLPAFYGNAAEWVGRADASRVWLPASERLWVFAGDVAVIGASGDFPEGHVVLVLDASRSPYIGVQQNSPAGSPVGLCRLSPSLPSGFIRVRRGA
jgi:hypothetical protein